MDKSYDIRQLADECKAGRLVVFAGAGCSASMGLPAWKALLDQLVLEVGLKTREDDPLLLASYLERAMGYMAFRAKIAERLSEPVPSQSPLLDALASLPTSLFLTTNYDHLLENALESHGFVPQVIVSDQDLPSIDLRRRCVVKLHGDIDSPETMVITSLDYLKYRKEREGLIKYAESQWIDKTLLLIGVSFRDPRIREIDDSIFRLFGKRRRAPYILLSTPSSKLEKEKGESKESYQKRIEVEPKILYSDFESYCTELSDRGYKVIAVASYDAEPEFLRKVSSASRRSLGLERQDRVFSSILLEEENRDLKLELNAVLAEQCHDLIIKVRGDEQSPRPGGAKAAEAANDLVALLRNQGASLSVELQLDGWLTACDAYINYDHHASERVNECFEETEALSGHLSKDSPFLARAAIIKAKRLASQGEEEKALLLLDPDSSPKMTALWLLLLHNLQRTSEAIEYIRSHKVDLAWAAQALFVLAMAGEVEEAFALRRKAKDLLPTDSSQKSRELDVALAEAIVLYIYLSEGKQRGRAYYLESMTDRARSLFERARELAEPIAHEVADLSTSLVAARAATVMLHYEHESKNWYPAYEYARLLLADRPISFDVAKVLIDIMLIGKAVKESESTKSDYLKLMEILKADHLDALWANIDRAWIQESFFTDPRAAFEILKELKHMKGNSEEKHKAAITLYNCAMRIGATDEAWAIIRGALPEDSDFIMVLEAERYLEADPAKYREMLESVLKEHPDTDLSPDLRFRLGRLANRQRRFEDAWSELEKAREQMPPWGQAEILAHLLYTATSLQDEGKVLETVERMEELGLKDEGILHSKAQALYNLKRYSEAQAVYKQLLQKNERNPVYARGLAAALYLMGQMDQAVKVLDPFCQNDEQWDAESLGQCVSILGDMGQEERAYELMSQTWAKYESDPKLTGLFLSICYSSGHDKEASKPMQRLMELEREGKTDKDYFRRVSLDQLKKQMEQWNLDEKNLRDQYRHCKILREMLITFQRRSPYLDWMIRTQALPKGIPAAMRHEHVLYATNGVCPSKIEDRTGLMERIQVPEDTDSIVIDYDALITIQELGIMAALEKRFKEIFYLDSYEPYWRNEILSLRPHQKSVTEAVKRINADLDAEKIIPAAPLAGILPAGKDPPKMILGILVKLAVEKAIPLIDAFNDFSEVELMGVEPIGMKALADWLYRRGWVPQKLLETVLQYQGDNRPVGNQDTLAFLDRSSILLVEKVTLDQLYSAGLAEALIQRGRKKFMIWEYDARRYRAERNELQLSEQALLNVEKLAKTMRTRSSFKKKSLANEPKAHKQGQENPASLALCTMKLALEAQLPLLSDDRMKSVFMQGQGIAAFDSCALLADLETRGILSTDEHIEAFLKLLRWRYRFLLPTKSLLHGMAQRYLEALPGTDMQEIARYVRESMQDPGILTEPLPPPFDAPISGHYFLYWMDELIEFLAGVWDNEKEYNCSQAKRLTEWVWRECFPPLPESQDSKRLGNFLQTLEVVLPHKLLRLALSENTCPSRYPEMIMNSLICLHPEKEWFKTLNESLISFIKEMQSLFGKDTDPRIFKALVAGVLSRLKISTISFELAFLFKDIGLDVLKRNSSREVDSEKAERESQKETESQKKEIISRAYASIKKALDKYNPSPVGPLTRVSFEQEEFLVIPHALLMAPDLKIRKAAAEGLLKRENGVPVYLSDSTFQRIEKLISKVLSPNDREWMPASKEAKSLALADFQYCFMAAAQIGGKDEHQYLEPLTEILEGLKTPSPQSVKARLPSPMRSAWDRNVIREACCKVCLMSGGVSTSPLQWILENIGFFGLGQEFSSAHLFLATVQSSIVRDPKTKNPYPDDQDLIAVSRRWLAVIWDEVRREEDPFIIIQGISTLLSLRPSAPEEYYRLYGPEFLDLLEQLTCDFTERNEKKETLQSKLRKYALKIISGMAGYYLKYLDMKGTDVFSEPERRVCIAWWLAWRFYRILRSIAENRSMDSQKRLDHYEDWTRKIDQLSRVIDLSYMYERLLPGRIRFMTLFGDHLLGSLLMEALDPNNTDDTKPVYMPYNGLTKPSTLLPPDVRDKMIEIALHDAIAAPPVPAESGEILPWLWTKPLSVVIPKIMRRYYGEDFRFLGKKRIAKVAKVEMLESFEDQNKILKMVDEIRAIVTDGNTTFTGLVCSYLSSRSMQGMGLPPSLKQGMTVDTINAMLRWHDAAGQACFARLSNTLLALVRGGHFDDAAWLSKQLAYANLTLASDAVAESLVIHGAYSVIMRGPEDLWERSKASFLERAQICKVLRELCDILDDNYPHFPLIARDRVRRIISDIRAELPQPEDGS